MNVGSPRSATTPQEHITVCICTYKRPKLLLGALLAVGAQDTQGRFTYSVVVADNDWSESARALVSQLAAGASVPIRYCVEPRQNIALARNRAVENSTGDFIAFIDDDEAPSRDWLVQLFTALETYRADGVLGPVVPHFQVPPPEWIRRGKPFDRPCPPTGTWLHWKQTRTGNALLRRRIFHQQENWFLPECGGGGEDVEFFRRVMAKGLRFVWCAEASVDELVPVERCRRTYLLKRALLRGGARHNRGWPALVSMAAVPIYTLALPVLLLLCGQHVFMRYLIKECDHLGRLLSMVAGDTMDRLALQARA